MSYMLHNIILFTLYITMWVQICDALLLGSLPLDESNFFIILNYSSLF